MYEKSTLPNGLRVITHAMPNSYSVSAALLVGTGSRYETAAQAGASHFIEHMLFKGTRRRPTSKAIAEAIEGVGGVLNAGTEKELTSYWAKVARQHCDLALDLLADMVLDPLFDSAELEKERQVITEEIHMAADMPQDLVNSLIDELVWPDHPLGREIAGTETSVAALRRQPLRSYMAQHYAPNNAVLSVAGNVSHPQIIEECTRLFGDWQPRPTPTFEAAPALPGPLRQAVRSKESEQAHICISAGGVPRQHPDRRALDLQNLILGGGMSSRLFLEIRERQALAYDVAAYLDYYADTGASIIYAGTDPDRVITCIEGILEEMRRLRMERVPEGELTRAKEYSKGRMLLGLEDSYGLAQWFGGQELLSRQILTVDEIIRQVDAVTTEDILRVSQAAFHADLLRIAIVGPVEGDINFGRMLDAA